MEQESIAAPTLSGAIGCRHATLRRLVAGITFPTTESMKQTGILLGIGFERFRTLSTTEKEKISEAIGAAGGGALGFGSIAVAINASGSVAGLSSVGITSGLAGMGAIVGGGMVAGVAIAAAIPIAAGALGYGIVKGVKFFFFSEAELNKTELDPRWEIEPPAGGATVASNRR